MDFLRISGHILQGVACCSRKVSVAFAHSLEHKAEVNTFPSQFSTETVGVTRNVASDDCFVIFWRDSPVRFTIRTTEIFIFDVTWLVLVAQDYRNFRDIVGVSLRVADFEVFRSHQTFGDVAVESVNRVAYLTDLVSAQIGLVSTEINDFVSDIRQVCRYGVEEVANLVFPVDIHFPTGVVDFSCVLLGRFCTNLCRVVEHKKYAFCILCVPVESESQSVVEHKEVESEVEHLDCFPRKLRVGKAGLHISGSRILSYKRNVVVVALQCFKHGKVWVVG